MLGGYATHPESIVIGRTFQIDAVETQLDICPTFHSLTYVAHREPMKESGLKRPVDIDQTQHRSMLCTRPLISRFGPGRAHPACIEHGYNVSCFNRQGWLILSYRTIVQQWAQVEIIVKIILLANGIITCLGR